MNIAIDIQSVITSPAGVGRYTKELVRALSKLKAPDKIILFYFNFLGKYEGLPFFPNKQIRFIPGRVYNKLWNYLYFPPINWLTGSYDIYHFPNFTLPPVSSGKTVITVHDVAFMRYPEYIEPENLKFLRAQLPQSLQRADKIITVSQFCKQEIIDLFGVPEDKISVTYEGVAVNIKKVRQNNLILPDKYILFIGMLEPRKNIEGLIRAFYMAKIRDYKLVIAGAKGWLYEGIFKLVVELGMERDIVFMGYVDERNLSELYSRASLFVYPSFYEGFGLPPLEAQSCRVPVIASRVNEVLGESAYFIDPNQPEDIANAIRTVIGNQQLQEELIAKGEEQSGKYLWKKTAEQTFNIYKDLVENKI